MAPETLAASLGFYGEVDTEENTLFDPAAADQKWCWMCLLDNVHCAKNAASTKRGLLQ